MKRWVVAAFAATVLALSPMAVAAPKGDSPKGGGKAGKGGGNKGGAKGGGGGPKDTNYRLPVWFTWERAELDVLIVPPGHGQIVNDNGALNGRDPSELDPSANSYLAAVEQSVAAWDRGIDTFGAQWLRDGLVTNAYVVGRDEIPSEALTEPEVVITSDETKTFILGVAVSFRAGQPRVEQIPCVVDNSKLFVTSFTFEDMYNINGQEYGHCLGLDHAEGGPKGDDVITHDIMFGTYTHDPGSGGTHRHCISNLDVRGVELVFGELFDQPSGGTATVAPSGYQRMIC